MYLLHHAVILCLLFLGSNASENLTLVDFVDGGKYDWEVMDDPVMGGVSSSNFTVDSDEGILKWQGECRIVPSLDAPGFCLIQTYGVHILPDASTYTHLTMKLRSTTPYSGFKVDFASVYHPNTQFTSFKADFPSDFNTTSCTGDWIDIAIPFTSFTWDWSSYTGEPLHTCAEDEKYCPSTKDLSHITQISVWAEGVEGTFDMDILSIGVATL